MEDFLTKSKHCVELRTTVNGSEFSSELVCLTPNQFDVVFSRMMEAVGTDKASDVANALGITPSSVSGSKKRNSIPDNWYAIIADKYGVSSDWLRTGEGEMRRGAAPPPAPAPESPTIYNDMEAPGGACPDCELIMVPLVEARLSAGTGSWETSAESQKSYAFRSDWLRRKGNPKAMKLMRVSGDSMADEIRDNDHVLIDESQRDPVPGKIYAISVHGMVYLKQIEAGQEGLLLMSKNKDYPPMTLDTRGDLHDGIWIMGKAIWFGRELD